MSAERYGKLIASANDYHRQAQWEEKLRVLQEALVICEEPDFPGNRNESKQSILYDAAGIWRRLGQYDRAKDTLKLALDAYPAENPSFKASVKGEIGVMARHHGQFAEAQKAFREQIQLAREAPPSIEADAEICRALGNEGMAAYNLWQLTDPKDPALLATAFQQIRERISRAQDLEKRVQIENPDSKYSAMARAWEIIGRDRLTLCYIAAGETEQAVRNAEESQRRQKREDPTVTAFSKFFYGNALWFNDQKQEALDQWNAPPGTCSSPMGFCKEPGGEHNGYLQLMSSAGVNFDSYDEFGFTALDHAVLSDSLDAKQAIPIVEEALRGNLTQVLLRDEPGLSGKDLDRKIDGEITLRRQQAELRRQYRTILQEQLRPELRIKSAHTLDNLRAIYAKFISEDTEGRSMFSSFRYVQYSDFLKHGKLPVSTSELAEDWPHASTSGTSSEEDHFIIFISYRWIGKDVPDDQSNAQWRRMTTAVQEFMDHTGIKPERLGMWLDYACIDQVDDAERQRGVDALPLAVTQCNAMISVVDAHYYERAWCGVEVLLMRTLVQSYGLHEWWEYTHDGLRKGDLAVPIDVQNLKLTKEELDRPKIDFLIRQSRLLAKTEV